MKHTPRLWLSAFLALVWSVGCDESPSQPLTDFETEDTRFFCRDWHPAPPSAERALFDMYFFRWSSTEDPSASEARQRIEDAGGVIVHEFAVDGLVRVLMATEEVPGLWPYANYAQGVTDARSHIVERAFVVYTRNVTEADVALIRRLGGRNIKSQSDDFYLQADLEDGAIRSLLLRPEVVSIGGSGQGCAD